MNEITFYQGNPSDNDLYFGVPSQADELIELRFNADDFAEFVLYVKEQQTYFRLKEDKQICAIRNLHKMKSLLQLDLQLAHNMISESEYDEELQKNPSRYVIEINECTDSKDLVIIEDIIYQAGLEESVTLDEASEMFSTDLTNIPQVGLLSSGR